MPWNERFLRADAAGGGDGTTDANSGANGAWTLTEAVANEAAGMRLNVKAGTYASTTTTRTFAAAGTATAPIWWRGFKTTLGDMDGAATSHGSFTEGLEIPAFTFTSGQFTCTGAHHRFSNLDIISTGTSAGQGLVSCNAAGCRYRRIRGENQHAGSTGRAFSTLASATGCTFIQCYGKSNAAASVWNVAGGSNVLLGCFADRGLDGFGSTVGMTLLWCISDDAAQHGINSNSGVNAIGFNAYSPVGDGINISVATAICKFVNCILDSCGGFAINSSGGVSGTIFLSNNAYRNNTLGNLNQITESEDTDSITELAIPWTNAPSDDFSLISTAGSKGTGFPGYWANWSFIGYMDIGAVQRQEAGGGGSPRFGASGSGPSFRGASV